MTRVLAAAAALAAVVTAGLVLSPARAALDLLAFAFALASAGVAACFFLATQHLTRARWSSGLRPIAEAWTLALAPGAALLAVVFAARGLVYPWAVPGGLAGEPPFAGKLAFLKEGFVGARMIVILIVWIVFAALHRRLDDRRLGRWAGLFVPAFAITFTVAANDWLLSVEPHWSSTIFAVTVFAGSFVQGVAAIALTAVLLGDRVRLAPAALHDLGKLLFAFTTFWAYLWVCQYLLIWYGNIPDEVTWYAARAGAAWAPLFFVDLAVNWLIPFFVLLPVRAKRSRGVVAAVSVLLLLGRWLDLYVVVAPSRLPAPAIGPLEVALAAACSAFIVVVVRASLARTLPASPRSEPCG